MSQHLCTHACACRSDLPPSFPPSHHHRKPHHHHHPLTPGTLPQNFAVQMQAWAAQHIHLSQDEMRTDLPRVWVSHAQLSEEVYRRLLVSVGALVVASHGEGWGRPQMEAAALEVPVITTNW